jgi:hypothetical protein
MQMYFLFFVIFLTGCVSIERDIYFKNLNDSEEKTIGSSRPGQYFRSEPINIAETNKPVTDDDANERRVLLSITNYADGSYLWGFIIPIVPVFFLPNMHFHLTKDESLQVSCQIVPFLGHQFMKKSDFGKNSDVLNEKGIEVAKKLRKRNDKCGSLSVTLPNGTKLLPNTSDSNSSRTNFTFNIAAADLKNFKVNVNEIQLESGRKVNINVDFNVGLEDWTRYYMPQIAP